MRDTRRTRLILSLLLVIALTLITIDFRGGASSPLAALRGFGTTIFGPIERGAAAVVEPIHNTFRAVVNASGSQQRVKALRHENARLRAQLRSRKVVRHQTVAMQGLLDFAGRGRYRVVPAQVVAVRGALGFEYTTTIDVGAMDGIKPNMTVVCAKGLVGRVIHVGARTSTVLLAVDGSSNVGARLADSNDIGVVQGRGLGSMELELLDSNASIQRGDRLVTFGSQGGTPYVPGVPIGTVSRVKQSTASLTGAAEVDPYVDFSSLDLVGVVVKPPRKDPRDSLLPPKPEAEQQGKPQGGGPSPGVRSSGGPGTETTSTRGSGSGVGGAG